MTSCYRFGDLDFSIDDDGNLRIESEGNDCCAVLEIINGNELDDMIEALHVLKIERTENTRKLLQERINILQAELDKL
jgi:uncharacterized small protein (DUF1192 family)